MSKTKKHGRPRKTVRFYYGLSPQDGKPLYWKCKVREATKPVTINGKLIDALSGDRGQVIGCHLSNCTQRNASSFPHPCLLASFTKTRALILTKLSGGRGTECVRYAHSYGKHVDLNDVNSTKEYVLQNPNLAARPFTLLPPPTQKKAWVAGTHQPPHREGNGANSVLVARGAIARAVNAGILPRQILRTLSVS